MNRLDILHLYIFAASQIPNLILSIEVSKNYFSFTQFCNQRYKFKLNFPNYY